MRFEVKRSEWSRGDSYHSALFMAPRNRYPAFPERRRCCLGFFANACGLSDEDIEGIRIPFQIGSIPGNVDFAHWDDWGSLFAGDGSPRVNEAIMACNDSSSNDETREQELTDLFSVIGHEIVFVD